MSLFRLRKETVVLSVGFAGIVGIIAFYTHAYIQRNHTSDQNTTQEQQPSLSDDAFTDYDTVIRKQQENPSQIVLIDIRSNVLFANEHIPRSTNIPFEVISNLEIKDGFTFVIVTTVGNEQGFGAMAMQALHTKNDKAPIFILRGGFEGWKQSGGATISIGDPSLITDQVKVKYITPEEYKKRLDTKQAYAVIDMRSHDAYAQGHVPNAVNLPLDQLEHHFDKIPKGVRIVTYGDSELEDFQSGVRLFDLGFLSTEVLKGGFADWKSKGFGVEK